MQEAEVLTTVRYVEDEDGSWAAATAGGPCIFTGSGPSVETQPPWLYAITAAARAGGQLVRTKQPPPIAIAWFSIDESWRLVSFDDWARVALEISDGLHQPNPT